MQGCVVQRQVMHGSPQVEHVAVSAAAGVEALENVLAQIGRERGLRIARIAVDGARSAALAATATQLAEQSQMLKHLLHGHLLAQEGEVYLGTLVRLGRLRLDSGRRRR